MADPTTGDMTSGSALDALGRMLDESTGSDCPEADRNAAAIRLACVWEARAPKVGNVHPAAAFDDCRFEDFCAAADRIAPILAGTADSASPRGGGYLGDRVWRAILATREVTSANVNLGIVLLIAPLATSKDRAAVAKVLAGMDGRDGAAVYRAIALAAPGGVKRDEVDERWDVAGGNRETESDVGDAAKRKTETGVDLIAAMRMARDRDRIALQYADDFGDFFDSVVPVMLSALSQTVDIGEAILRGQLRLMASGRDTLIERKCGPQVADEAVRRAAACLPATPAEPMDIIEGATHHWISQKVPPTIDPLEGATHHDPLEGATHHDPLEGATHHWDPNKIADFDAWLRADGNRRNPGTTADLIAAALYWLVYHR
jgi:triphosphoribosyl-dephospho-CoA synthase